MRSVEIAKMRASNAEWDFMGRTFLVLALANMSLREPASQPQYLTIMDTIIEETLRLVPDPLREASLALGTPRWKTILRIVLPTARAGIMTGVVLSLARAGGETAPLLLTTLGNQFFSLDLLQPMAALPVQIYNYARAPYPDWQVKAWGGALILIVLIALLSGLSRLVLTRRFGRT